MTRLRWLLALPALMIATSGPSTAADIRDKANLFSAEAVKKAEADLDRIEKEHSVPVTIETIDSLEGVPIRDVTTRHAEQAGAKGIYVLIAKADSKMYIEASKGFRTALTRDKLQEIDESFTRQFKKKDYDAGLSRGVSQIETTVVETRPAAKVRRAGQAPIAGKPSSGGLGVLLSIGLGILALFIVIRVLGAIFGGNRGGYAGGNPRMMGQGGMGGPGYGPGYGGGGGGGGFMSSMFGGIGGALAGNWLYDQFSGRHHDSALGQSGYDPAAGAAPAETGPEWGTGGAEGDWGGGDAATGGGGDWGGGGADTGGGGGDWGGGGGGGGDWGGGGGGGGDDGGSW